MDFSVEAVRSAISACTLEEVYQLLSQRMKDAEAPVIRLRTSLEQQLDDTEALVDRLKSELEQQIKEAREPVIRLQSVLADQKRETQNNISVLKSVWNEQAKICQLPVEVMVMILCAAVDGVDSKLLPRPDRTTRRDLVRLGWTRRVQLTSVCKHWRVVALGDPQYWAGIPSPTGTHRMDMLLRSKEIPRIFEVGTEDLTDLRSGGPGALDAVQWQMVGTRLLELIMDLTSGRVESLGEVLDCMPRDEAPVLRRISIKGPARIGSRSAILVIPLHVFTVPKPVLRHLELERCDIPWGEIQAANASPTNLHSLRITQPRVPCPHPLLFSILASSWDLKELYLDGAFNSITEPRMDPPVPLLSLHHCGLVLDRASSFVYFYAFAVWEKTFQVWASITLEDDNSIVDFVDACEKNGI